MLVALVTEPRDARVGGAPPAGERRPRAARLVCRGAKREGRGARVSVASRARAHAAPERTETTARQKPAAGHRAAPTPHPRTSSTRPYGINCNVQNTVHYMVLVLSLSDFSATGRRILFLINN